MMHNHRPSEKKMILPFTRKSLAIPLATFLVLTPMLSAQTPGTGAIVGAVHDPSGLVLVGAAVSAVNESTDLARTATTNSVGIFTMPLLSPGDYSITVRSPGFANSSLHAVRVVVGETSSVDVKMVVNSVNVSVAVTADAEIMQSRTSTLGGAVLQESMNALPLASRNYTQILSLSPGVVVALPNATALGRGSQNVSANGAKTVANNVQFNGVDANNLAQNSVENATEEVGVAIPAPDTIEEFKVQTGNYDASYGRGVGANVDVVTKQGTNQLHGSVWEFLRNNILNANDFFLKLGGQPRPELKQNQFGAAVGGPIWRNKTFFFGAYQGLRDVNGFGAKATALLPQLTSDRSATTLGAQFCPTSPGRASAAYQTFAGGTQVACNGSNISPVALALLNFKFANGQYAVPSPQVNLPTGAGQFPIGLSTYALPATYNEDQYTANLEQVFSTRHQLTANFFYARAPWYLPFSPNAATVPGWPTNELDQNAMLVVSDTHVFGPSLINIFRFGYMRFDGIASIANPILASDLKTVTPTGTTGSASAPGITIDGLFTVGDSGTPAQSQVTNSFIWQDTVSRTSGRHTLSLGAEAKRHQVEVNAPFSVDGLLDIATFDDFLLGESAAQNHSPQGISNVTFSGGSSGFFRRDERYTDFAAFVQDDIQVTSRLTVNAGLRYEIFGPPSEIHGRLLTFDPAIATPTAPASGTLSGFVVPANLAGPLPAGVTRLAGNNLWSTTYDAISPRFGFALRLTDRPATLLRGGYGIYFDRLSAGMIEGTLSQPPFSVQQFFADSQNGAATLQQPYSPLLPPNSAYPLFQPRVPGGAQLISGVSPRAGEPYTEEYNLNLQFAPARDYLIETGYVGTRSLHIAGSTMFNQAELASPSHPVNGVTTNTVNNVVQRLPFAGVSPVALFSDTKYLATYNSLQASVTKRMSHGLQFLGSYTWSRNLDETSGSNGAEFYELWLLTNDQTNPRQAYGPSNFDRTNRGVLSLTYRTPKVSWNSWIARKALTGWEVSGIFVAQSGSPVTIIDNSAGQVYGTYSFEHRAQLSGQRVTTAGSLFSRVINGYLNPAGFTSAPEAPFGSSPADTDFGNSGVGMVRGPGQRDVDAAIERSFAIEGSSSISVRAEFFNLTNTPNFANPNNMLNTGSAFGTVSSTSNNPRIIQLAIRYAF
jgi:Carboxypeptidase regulatory-like domain/TonB-dependent Receptor Plug Domain/TonB dependent receptor